MKNKKKLFLVFIVLVTILIIVLVFSRISKPSKYEPYIGEIKIELTDKEGKTRRERITIEDDGSNGKVNTSYLEGPIYIENNKMYYFSKGRYKSIPAKLTYLDMYKYLTKLDLGQEIQKNKKNLTFNPKLSSEDINSILSMLFIGADYTRGEFAYIVVKNDALSEFRLNLPNLGNYNNVVITMSFDKLKEKIKKPKIYKDLIDRENYNYLYIISQ